MAIQQFVGNKYVGLSTDIKPTNANIGSIFYETDTLRQFIYAGGVWEEVISQGGVGDSGYSGYSGESGAIGQSGYSGEKGDLGDSGFSGERGQSGFSGFNGQTFNWAGAWGSGIYYVNDCVEYNGEGYICIQQTTGSEEPGIDTAYWSLFVEKGASGVSGATGASGFSGAGTSGATGDSGYSGQRGESGFSGLAGATFTWKGTWISGVYDINDCVEYNGEGYVCIQATTTQEPTVDPTYWSLFVEKGAIGESGISGNSGFSGINGTSFNWAGSWATGLYALNDCVEYNGQVYICIQATTGTEEPSIDTAYWSLFVDKGYSGFSGYSGQDGIIGVDGASGFSGFSGYSGQDGILGGDGESGYSGFSGEKGESGVSGATGTGTSGFSGVKGESGFSGVKGESGTSGEKGIDGEAGLSGFSGFSGQDGVIGSDGASGYSGYSGIKGDSGYSGVSGWGSVLSGDMGLYGFYNRSETTISFDGVDTFTLADGGSGWTYYRNGVRCAITGNKTIQVASPMVNGTKYFIFIDSTNGTLVSSTSPWTLNDTKVPVVVIYWDNTLTPKFMMGDERHTCKIDRAWHREKHLTQGTQYVSGCTLSGYVLNSTVEANKTFGISASTIADEDIFISAALLSDPDGATPTYYNLYRTSATTYAWAISDMPFKYSGATAPYGYIEYDVAGTSTPSANNRWVNTYLYVSNAVNNSEANPEISNSGLRYFIIQGRGSFNSAAAAYAEAFSSFDVTGIPLIEGIALYQLTWNTSGNANTIKGRVVLDRVQRITSNIVSTTAVASTSHNTLTGLQGGTVNEYYHLTETEYATIQATGGSGYSGTSGYSGEKGEIGNSGFSGVSGEKGVDGEAGLSGFSGYSGEKGDNPGSSGVSGYSGTSGEKGADGVIGGDGASGFSGFSGYSGDNPGSSGYSGFSGERGISGYSGTSGVRGFSGYSGEKGFSGDAPGTSGFSGTSGTSGTSGQSGAPGGTSGWSGFSGVQGYSGLSGRSGYSGVQGFSGMSGDAPGTSGFSGMSGTSGQSGAPGGTSGWSGYSGVQGYSGISGYSGVGTSGLSGKSGERGISGYSGERGISGYSGEKGTTGDSGFSGVSGWSGDNPGSSGYSGYSGVKGEAGGVYLTAVPADLTGNGTTITLTANENQAFGDACYINADGEAQIAKADAIANANAILMALETISANNTGTYLVIGIARNDTWNWTVGGNDGLIYLSTTGTTGNTLTQTAPSGSNNVIQVLGVATNADRMLFKPSLVQVEHT